MSTTIRISEHDKVFPAVAPAVIGLHRPAINEFAPGRAVVSCACGGLSVVCETSTAADVWDDHFWSNRRRRPAAAQSAQRRHLRVVR